MLFGVREFVSAMAEEKKDVEQKKGESSIGEAIEPNKSGTGFTTDRIETTIGEGWMKNKRVITGALIGVVVLIAGIFWWGSQQQQKELDAQSASATTFRYFEIDSTQQALNADANRLGLLQIADEYGSTPTGNLARYMAGVALVEAKQPDQALEQLEAYDENGSILEATHYSTIAAAHEQRGDMIAAAEAYKKAAEIDANSFTSPFFLMEAGRCFEQAGDKAQAKAVYESVKAEYPNSREGRSIEKYIARVNVGG